MILVTGATGNVGAELVQQLVEQGQSVRVFVRDAGKVAHLDDRVERAIGDLTQPETLEAALHGVEGLFLVSFQTDQDSHALAAANRAGVQKIVKLSSMEASHPTGYIGTSHVERENLIRESGLAWTILRPGQFMSNTLQWAGMIKQQSAVYSPAGDGKVAPIDPYDIAAVAATALTQPGHAEKIYELTGSELTSAREQVEILARLLAKPIRFVDIPTSVAAEGMLKAGTPPIIVEALTILIEQIREGKGDYQSDTVQQVTGRAARNYEMWARQHLAAFC